MSAHQVRNRDHLDGQGRLRDLIRDRLPDAGPMTGVVATDLDVVLRFYGPLYGLDARGRFGLIEVKHGLSLPRGGQSWTFGLLDEALARSPLADRYLGLRVLHDLGDGWRWQSDPATYSDAELADQLQAWPQP